MTTVIHADRLIDGTGAPPVTDPVLVLDDCRVTAVFQGKLPDGAAAPDAQRLDYPGCTPCCRG